MYLYLSPFVHLRETAGERYYVCEDPALHSARRRRGVKYTRELADILDAFRNGDRVATVQERFAAEGLPLDVQLFRTLMDVGLLRPQEMLRTPNPSLEIEITSHCNADCTMCPRDQLRPVGRMSEYTFSKVVELLQNNPTQGVIIQGIGEPTLHPRLVEYVRTLRMALGELLPILIVTNGIRMSTELYLRLLAAGATEIQWSFHALDTGIAAEILGTDRVEHAKENLEGCLRADAKHISVNFVLMERNREELATVRNWIRSRGLPPSRMHVIPVFSRGGTVDTEQLFARIHRPTAAPCLYVRKSVFIAWNGDLLPCSNDIRGEYPYGNVEQDASGLLLRRWQENLATSEMTYEICRSCDHHSRSSLRTGWFDAASHTGNTG
ncbi:radical SAM/SPASM domain-containing protein [Streptomyces sp. NPDC088775]|uniref:radical SAM/SPASM domain-containing protein n=1 Tax=Streptomyces sp. NPDC088775 TaxID=3365896 RepID=UPI0037F5044D